MRFVVTLVALVCGFVPFAKSLPRQYEEPKPAAAPREDDPLRLLFAKSDTVVTGTFVSVAADSKEAGFHHYRVEVKIDGVLKGDAKVGETVTLAFVRIEPTAEDQLPILKEKNKAMLFLTKLADEKRFAPADPWFAFQHPQSEFVKALKELAK